MSWHILYDRVVGFFRHLQPLVDAVPRPALSASNDVIDEYFIRSSEQARDNIRRMGLKSELSQMKVMQRMVWEAVPPEQRQMLSQRLQEMYRDHYRLSPEAFQAKYRQYLDDEDEPQE